MSEKDIQKLILEWLFWNKIFNFRNNTGAFATKAGGFYHFGTPGSPDIICVIDGKFIGIEVKAKGGKQSPAQKEFQGKLVMAGGQYILAHCLEDVASALNH